jgi:predicted nucleotidyltransferase
MTETEIQKVKAFLASKEKSRERTLDARYKQAVDDAKKIIEGIKSKFRVARIYQWGSLLDRSRFSEISDIDIAIEGIQSPRDFFAILGLAMDCTELPVDVVEIENLPAKTADRIRRTGRLVYEGKHS